MDVVYNHVPVGANGRDDAFGNITNRYFLPQDISGAGRSLDGGVPMVSQMIRDSLEYWVREYHVDGFRFDLLGVFRYLNVGEWARYLNAKYPDRVLLIYGEPYAASDGTVNGALSGDLSGRDQVRQGTVAFISADHVGVFNTSYRNAVRGDDLNGGGAGVNDRPSRLFSAQQEAPAYPRVGTGSSVSPWLNFGCRDAVFGRSMKCHPVEGGRPSPTPSFSLRSGSTARTVGCSPVPCPQPPRRARSTTSAISGD